ncbi:MAG: CHC2 zinc finger domain-containing protein, partial [Candidatus Spyradocola sp.]
MDYARIKEMVTMEQVLADYAIAPGRGGWAICPLHADRHPSLKVYPDGYYCFACGSGGDVITFVARMERLTNEQAAALIMARHSIGFAPVDTEESRRRRMDKQRKA